MICCICGCGCERDVMHGQYMYWKCTKCFTSQVWPQPSPEILQEYYDQYHLSSQVGGVYDDVEERMQADFPAKVQKLLKYTKDSVPKLLDVGCGKGFFIKAATLAKVMAQGIDYSRSGVDFAVKTLGVNAVAGNIEDRKIDWHESFDAVTLWATIEHLSAPESVINAINCCLKPNGLLFLDTGLGNIFWEKFLLGHNQWYEAPEHLFVFSENGLVHLLNKCGFDIVHIDNNYDRSFSRKCIRWLRHAFLCVTPRILFASFIGRRGIKKMRDEAKWPLGRLISIVAQKRA